jgi:RNA polymerase sigma-70 factor (ECF subfamily)
MESEAELEIAIEQVKAGRVDAYRLVIACCELRVRLAIAAVLPDKDSVEDVAQEVFLKAYQKLHEYQAGTDFLAWIRTIARQMAYNERKSHMRRLAMKSRVQTQIAGLCEQDPEQSLELVKDEALNAMQSCKEELKGHARQLLEDFYVQGRSSAEIAEGFQREEGWVRLTLFRARRTILECMKRKGAVLHG